MPPLRLAGLGLLLILLGPFFPGLPAHAFLPVAAAGWLVVGAACGQLVLRHPLFRLARCGALAAFAGTAVAALPWTPASGLTTVEAYSLAGSAVPICLCLAVAGLLPGQRLHGRLVAAVSATSAVALSTDLPLVQTAFIAAVVGCWLTVFLWRAGPLPRVVRHRAARS